MDALADLARRDAASRHCRRVRLCRDYLLARDLCSDAAAADLRRVAALGDGAAGAEFLLAFAHYNALDAS